MPDLPPTSRRILAPLALALVVALAAFAALATLAPNSRIVYDEQSHHLPAIRAFASQMPTPDVRDYAVATTPGYHVMMASAVRYLGFGETGLRAINIGLSMAFAGVVGWMLSRRARAGEAVPLGLPLIACVYVLTSAAWILPENAAWALVACILALALERTTGTRLVLMSVALLLLVLVRQAHAWCGAIIVAAAAIDATGPRDQLRRGGIGLLATVPAAAVVIGFVILWGGLVPPMFQPGNQRYELSTQYSGWGPAAAGFTLALIGFLGLCLVPWVWRAARTQLKVTRLPRAGGRFWTVVAVGAAIGVVVSILPETSYHLPSRRSGIWRLIQMTPAIGERSPLLVGLAAMGGAIAAIALAAQTTRTRVILLTALVAFIVAQTANPMIWQRYYEPMVLLWLIAAVAYAERPAPLRVERALQWAGLIGLTLFQIAVTLYTLRGGAE